MYIFFNAFTFPFNMRHKFLPKKLELRWKSYNLGQSNFKIRLFKKEKNHLGLP
jgi:hypothetical protein